MYWHFIRNYSAPVFFALWLMYFYGMGFQPAVTMALTSALIYVGVPIAVDSIVDLDIK